MYQNYIFDLYGTLADVHTNERKPYLWRKVCDLLAGFGADYTPAECRNAYFSGITLLEQESHTENVEIQIEEVYKRMFLAKNVTPTEQYIFTLGNLFRIVSREKLGLYPGVTEFLTALKKANKKIYLLSNAQRLFTEPEVHALGLLPYFDGVFYSSDIGIKKPAPAFMERLLTTYGLDRKKSIMIGNDPSCDVGIANACQMDSLYIHSNISPALSGSPVPATYVIMDGDFTKVSPLILKS